MKPAKKLGVIVELAERLKGFERVHGFREVTVEIPREMFRLHGDSLRPLKENQRTGAFVVSVLVAPPGAVHPASVPFICGMIAAFALRSQNTEVVEDLERLMEGACRELKARGLAGTN